MNRITRRLTVLLTPPALLAMAACGSTGASAEHREPAIAVRLDGSIDEWPDDTACLADGDFVYVRFSIRDQELTLQNSPLTTAVYLDLDADAATGLSAEAPSPDAVGADMIVEFSPRSDGLGNGKGVAVFAVDHDGTRRVVRHADVDLSFAPTFAAPWYELRFSRRPSPASALAGTLSGASSVRGMVAVLDPTGRATMVSDGFTASLPSRSAEQHSTAVIPDRIPGGIRVVSWNVLKSAPAEQPETFARVFRALAPDAVLLQEWPKGDDRAIASWFTAFVPSSTGWHVLKSTDGDVAIASRYPLTALASELRAHDDDRPVRFVAAVAATPQGPVLLGSVHLKCCGCKDSVEDARRIDEAGAVGAWLREQSGLPRFRVVGGDLNLVGSRPPLDLLRAGGDADGSDLDIADACVLGDASLYTWRDPSTEFTPGRLDFLVWSGSSVPTAESFVIDTSKLSPRALSGAGVERGDTEASDHLPVVIDLDTVGARSEGAE